MINSKCLYFLFDITSFGIVFVSLRAMIQSTLTPSVHKTLYELFDYSTTHFSKNKAFYTVNADGYTYDSFKIQTLKIARLLAQYGLQTGDKVAIYSHNTANWPVAFFATTAFGFVSVPLLPDFASTEISFILKHSESKALFASQRLLNKVSDEAKESLSLIVCLDTFTVLKGTPIDGRVPEFHQPKEEELATLIYTSGTTGTSKGVMLSHRNWCANLQAAKHLRPGYEWDVWLSFLPLSHTLECSLSMILPMESGACAFYLDRLPTASILLPVLKVVRPTTILSVPLVIEKIYRNAILPKFNSKKAVSVIYKTTVGRKILNRIAGKTLKQMFGGRIRFFGIGGAKLDTEVERFLLEARFPYAIGYGLTETAPLLAGANPQMVHLQSTGPAVKGVTLRIDNPNPKTGEGEVVAKGDNVMMGYYKNPVATAEAFTPDGWFRTKDLGVFDRKGRLYLRGRLGNMFVGASGENIYPEEIESVINNHQKVEESLVVQRKGKLVAIIELKDDVSEKMDEIKKEVMDYVNSKVNHFSHITAIETITDHFQKTATQKIKRYKYK